MPDSVKVITLLGFSIMTVRIMGQKHKSKGQEKWKTWMELEMHVLQVRSFLGVGGLGQG